MEKTTLNVNRMSCGHCVKAIKESPLLPIQPKKGLSQ